MYGQKEARKREPADMQREKGWTFEIINYSLYLLFCLNKETNRKNNKNWISKKRTFTNVSGLCVVLWIDKIQTFHTVKKI